MQCLLRRARITTTTSPAHHASRFLSSTPPILQKSMPSRPKPPPDSDLEESYLKGSGPGGQKINKTNSAVQIKHIPTGIVVKSQATRSRAQNRKHAREILAQRLDDLRNGEQSRAGIVGAVRKKRADSAAKKSRRKYKKLEEERTAATTTTATATATATEEQEDEAEQAITASRDSISYAEKPSCQAGVGKTRINYTGNPSQISSDTSPSTSINSSTR
ncbi:hypothetical protein LLEC1_04430 [Akanthomyces lecanii]|uniref:Prokaryotic-type class I peptide chain release factors domain-containing protein n=1 Tax=Cordyceps confragosa TaxID=2714763 RepID=A0A179ITV6_CORDF|nr:hypothetical protein LLEC1_04430 [Akanthomyces lecanii]